MTYNKFLTNIFNNGTNGSAGGNGSQRHKRAFSAKANTSRSTINNFNSSSRVNISTFTTFKTNDTTDGEMHSITQKNPYLAMAIQKFERGEYNLAYAFSDIASEKESLGNCLKIATFFKRQKENPMNTKGVKESKTIDDIRFFWLNTAAGKGDSEAQRQVGSRYLINHCKKPNPSNGKLGLQWLWKSADQGNTVAMWELGTFYMFKKELLDLEKAVVWFKKAANCGMAQAQYQLAYCYEFGVGTEKDIETAYVWYIKAAENGSELAQNKLVLSYEIGTEALPKNKEDAEYWQDELKRSKFNELFINSSACNTTTAKSKPVYTSSITTHIETSTSVYCKVANDFLAGSNGVPKDQERSFLWLEKAANLGCTATQLHLGRSYLNGWNVEVDYSKALKWLTPLLETDMEPIVKQDIEKAIIGEDNKKLRILQRNSSEDSLEAQPIGRYLNRFIKQLTPEPRRDFTR